MIALKGVAQIQAFVQTLAARFQHSVDAGFVEAGEQEYLGQVTIVGLPHGGSASADDLNAVLGTHFLE